jgi:hypothetical protein
VARCGCDAVGEDISIYGRRAVVGRDCHVSRRYGVDGVTTHVDGGLALSFMRVAVATVGRTAEGALEASVVETVQPAPSPVPAATSAMGQKEAGVSEVSAEDMATGQVSMPVSPTPATTGHTVLEEALLQEGSTLPGVGAGPSQSLVQVGDKPQHGEAPESGGPRGKILS